MEQENRLTGKPKEGKPIGVTAFVTGIITRLPDRVQASTGVWHWAFMRLRDVHASEFPELAELEFSKKPNVWPVSERLDRIFQIIEIAGGSTNDGKNKLRDRTKTTFQDRQPFIQQLTEELAEIIDSAPQVAP